MGKVAKLDPAVKQLRIFKRILSSVNLTLDEVTNSLE